MSEKHEPAGPRPVTPEEEPTRRERLTVHLFQSSAIPAKEGTAEPLSPAQLEAAPAAGTVRGQGGGDAGGVCPRLGPQARGGLRGEPGSRHLVRIAGGPPDRADVKRWLTRHSAGLLHGRAP
ncbi:MAG TPA: hypothetical protein VNA24_06640 [Hyalangium sp.]|nr:hypothetical protein [Hyalangium sp.]